MNKERLKTYEKMNGVDGIPDGISDFYKWQQYGGPDKIIKILENSESVNQTSEEQSEIKEMIEKVGESRVRQLLGLGGEPWLTLWVSNDYDESTSRKQKILNRILALWNDGKIADFDIQQCPGEIGEDWTGSEMEKEAFEQYNIWGIKQDYTLEPHFRRKSKQNTTQLTFPDLFLVVRSVRDRNYLIPTEDQDTSGLKAVFPCADDHQSYQIEDYLSAIEQGTDWKVRSPTDAPTTPDFGAHGAIKSYIFQNPAETVGKKWVRPEDEKLVRDTDGKEGQVDIIFKHRSKNEYLLVEVKPEKEKVDSAFGQIGRYRYQFLSERNLPHLSSKDVHLSIAAPDFHPAHEKIAKDWGVNLVEVGE